MLPSSVTLGSVLCQYGSGAAGREDGREKGAKFNTPQGMVFYNEALYVADTNNHLIRKVSTMNFP